MEEDSRVIYFNHPQMSHINYQNKCRKLKDKILNSYVDELRQSTFYQVYFKSVLNDCSKELGERKIKHLLCYGLGPFQSGIDSASRYQLALLILLYEYLHELDFPLDDEVEVFDPSFERMDRDTLLAFTFPKFRMITENEHCARRVLSSNHNECTLFYMPHLDKYLYNNLLGINWQPENLDKLVILGNSFHEMIDNEPKSKCPSNLYYMNQLVCNFKSQNKYTQRKGKMKHLNNAQKSYQSAEALVEFKIDDSSFKHNDIFNSLAIHLIDRKWLVENENTIEDNRLNNWIVTTACLTEDSNN